MQTKLKILIIEDSKTYAEYISSILGITDYKVTIAHTGKAGMHYLNNASYNLVLLDMQLPDCTGLDIVKIIRKKYTQNELPVVFISATNNEKIITQALEAGANDFIQKPITEITLKLKIKNLLQLQQTNEQLIATHKKLKNRETNYRLIFENSPVGILSFNKEGIITACNERFAQIIGSKKEKLLRLDMLSLPDKKLVAALQKTIDGSTAYYEGKYQSVTGKKESIVKSVFKPLIADNGLIEGGVGIIDDITEQALAEEALKKSEATNSQMVANIGDVIVIVDKNAINKYKSSNIEKLFGWKPEELIGKSTWENVHPDDLSSTQNFLGKIATKANATGTTECRYKRKDETYVWIEITITNLLHEPSINGFLGNYHDITERKKVAEEIQLKNEQLTLANSDKDKFMSILAHDLKSPFITILGFLGLLIKNIRKYPIEKIEEQLGFINHSAINTYNLLEGILDWTRAHSGKMTFNPKTINLHKLCSNVFDILNEIASAKNITLKNNIVDDLILIGDENMLKSVFRNLISNAIKFTNSDGVIAVNAQQNLSNIIVSVSDNGIGMTPDIVSKLFDISHTHSTPGTANERGTGLGLLLCKEFVEKHKGSIWVESELGKGSEFKFSIPFVIFNDA